MAEVSTTADVDQDDGGLRRSITGRQLFFYTLGDVLGSGIYVLIGLVAAARDQANRLIGEPVIMRWESLTWTVTFCVAPVVCVCV